ncbi:MAG: ATP-binding cassette domain-containing protein, partial [Phycisphaerae bacterium]
MPSTAQQQTGPRSRTARRPAERTAQDGGVVRWLTVRGARHNNLQDIDVTIPLGRFTCVTGVSGSGKSSLVNDILYEALARDLNGAISDPGAYERIDGKQHLDKVIAIDQTPIGRTPRSNPATYIKVFDEIRDLFTRLPDARLRGYKPGRFSFNVPMQRGGGRCEACEGNGSNRIEMDFLADVWVTCPVCEGRRFTRETLQIRFGEHRRPGGYSIADVLEMDVQQALELFENQPRIRGMLQTLHDVGLDYIKLGQPSPTLSGGEAQRIKLARELVKKATGRTLYVLDEPTTGLHFDDIRRLLAVLHGFVDAGNTVVVIEHNLDVVKTADWVIDLGPEGGAAGGRIVATGTPEDIAANEASHTGRALGEVLPNAKCKMRDAKGASLANEGAMADSGAAPLERAGAERAAAVSEGGASASSDSHTAFSPTNAIRVVGARQHNLKDVSVAIPRNQMTVCTGVSGSGKTSFAIDTVYTEGYRRYVESLSAYARQFLGQLAKPRVDHIEGLSPAICIEQKAASRSPRSTVGTITEVYDYMRVLWARIGTPCCTRCGRPIGSQTVDEIVARVFGLDSGAPIILLAPVALGDGESYGGLFTRLKNSGYTRVRIDGEIRATAQATTLDARRRHRIEVVIDRTIVRPANRGRITEAVEHALAVGAGVMTLVVEEVERVVEESHETTKPRNHEAQRHEPTSEPGEGPLAQPGSVGPRSSSVGPPRPTSETAQRPVPRIASAPGTEADPSSIGAAEGAERREHADTAAASSVAASSLRRSVSAAREMKFSQRLACTNCGVSYEDLSPQHFSFNSQLGWCETCEGLGVQRGAPAASIIRNPRRSLFDGAIAGWPRIDPRTPFGRLLVALCARIGVRPDAPLGEWSAAQRHALMFGTSGEWIESDGRAAIRRRSESGVANSRTATAAGGSGSETANSKAPAYRFHWRGFFPAIDAVTRNSWELRHRLHNVVADVPCIACQGGRLRADAAAVRLVPGAASRSAQTGGPHAARSREGPEHEPASRAASDRGPTIVDVCRMPLSEALGFFRNLRLSASQRKIAGELLKEITSRLQFLVGVGLEYLTLHRPAPTLSGGEAQRIRLASQIGSGLSGVLYVLDEPTIGLHPRDTRRLIDAIHKLRNLGNTLLLVEHDRDVIRSADRILDFGPGAGTHGGRIVAEGEATQFCDVETSHGRMQNSERDLRSAD